jgi:hypothetical protein
MATRARLSSIALIGLLLTACANPIYVGWHPRWPAEEVGPGAGIVLIEIDSDEAISFVNGMNVYPFTEGVDVYEDGHRSIYAFRVPVGAAWKIGNISPSALQGLSTRYFNFRNSVPLMIEKAGIYYYGRIVVRNGQAWLDDERKEDAIRYSRVKFPEVYEVLEPVNF